MSLEEQALELREILKKAYERIFPALGYLISSQAGFAASVAVFTTWMLAKMRGAKTLKEAISDEELILVDLSVKIEEKKNKVRVLEEELEKTSDELSKRILEQALYAEKQVLDTLLEEYELHQLRIIALKKLRDLGDKKLYEKVWKLLKDIEKGKKFEDKQLEVLRILEDKWKKRQLKTNVMLQLLRYG